MAGRSFVARHLADLNWPASASHLLTLPDTREGISVCGIVGFYSFPHPYVDPSLRQVLPYSRSVRYLQCMDVLVLPSRTTRHWKEQFGKVLVEVLAVTGPCKSMYYPNCN